MNKQVIIGLVVLGFGLEFLSGHILLVSAHTNLQNQGSWLAPQNQTIPPTPLPTEAELTQADATPEARVLPPVGSNAGLVIGAIVLVLIIIGGVLSARLRPKH
jgi:hypothetical protein